VEWTIEYHKGHIVQETPQCCLEVQFFFLGWRETREADRGLAWLCNSAGDERVVALNSTRNSLLDVGLADFQVLIEVCNIFGKNFVAKVTRVLVLRNQFNVAYRDKKSVHFWQLDVYLLP